MNQPGDTRNSKVEPRELAVLAVLIVLGLLVRLYYTTYSRVVWGDEPFYLWLGQSLWSGEGYNLFGYSGVHFPPLFPVIAGASNLVLDDLLLASNILYVTCGSLLILPLYALARQIYGVAVAWATGLVTAVYPALTSGVLAWGTMTEPLYLLLVAVAILALAQGLAHGKLVNYLVLGASLGLAYLTRTEALAFAGIALALLALVRLCRRDRLARVMGRIALAGLVFLLFAAPYLLTIRNSTGRWGLSGAAGMAFVSTVGLAENNVSAFDAATWGLDPASGEVYLFAPASEGQGLVSALLADPMGLVGRTRANLREMMDLLLSARLVPWLLAALAVLGLFGRAWDKPMLWGQMALIASLASPLSYVPFFVQDRYLAGLLLPALVWIGAGSVFLAEWLFRSVAALRGQAPRSTPPIGVVVIPAVLVAVVLLWQGPRLWQSLQRTKSFQPGHLAAAAYLREQGVNSDTVIMSRYPAIAFHAGTRWIPTPAAAWPDVAAYARQRDSDYLAMDGWEATLRPQLSFLGLPQDVPSELRYLTTLEEGPDPVVIYEFQP
jgi:hypothetical protein